MGGGCTKNDDDDDEIEGTTKRAIIFFFSKWTGYGHYKMCLCVCLSLYLCEFQNWRGFFLRLKCFVHFLLTHTSALVVIAMVQCNIYIVVYMLTFAPLFYVRLCALSLFAGVFFFIIVVTISNSNNTTSATQTTSATPTTLCVLCKC